MNGLTSEEVRQQFYEGNVNVQPDSSAKTVGGIVKENVFTYFNGIFLLLAILLIAAGSFRSLTFLPVVIVNTLIGIIQEVHAKNVLDKLAVLNQSTAVVLREGREEKIPVSRLVLGDVIRLRSGSQIPADAEVIEGSITVNESLLTGEEDEIEKTPAGQKALKSGSFVIAGDCFARLTQVGRNSYISKLTAKAKEMPGQEQSEMVRDINRLILLAGILIIPIGIILFVQSFAVQGNSFSDSVVSMVAAVIGMIPEGLYLLVSVALALSAVRLAQNQVVLHDMKSIETLARADVFCVDKTGTITDNEMTVSDCVAPEDSDPAAMTQTRMLISRYLKTVTDDNITMQALRGWFPEEGGFYGDPYPAVLFEEQVQRSGNA
jgi:cation-transporting ATPase E